MSVDNTPLESTADKQLLDSGDSESEEDVFEKITSYDSEADLTKEEFYHQSYKIFQEMNNFVQAYMSDAEEDCAMLAAYVLNYIDLTNDYPPAKDAHKIWDLCQCLYFSPGEPNFRGDLAEWLNTYEPLRNLEQEREHDEDEDYEEHNKIGPVWIWESSRRHLLRGNFDNAVEILEFSLNFLSDKHCIAIKDVIDSIKHLEKVMSFEEESFTKFDTQWSVWKDSIKKKYNAFLSVLEKQEESDEHDDELLLLYGILAGDEGVIRRCGDFFDVVVGIALFSHPQISLPDLNTLGQKVDISTEEDLTMLACAYLLMGEFDDVFDLMSDDLWLLTHMGYALIVIGAKKIGSTTLTKLSGNELVVDPVFYCIQSYANEIAHEFDMWKEAVIYLTSCQGNSELWIKQLLGEPPLPSKDNDQILSILSIAEEFSLTDTVKYLHQALGHRYEHEKKIREATVEYGKAKDLKALDRLAHVQFSHYLKTGKLDDVVTDMDELKASPHYAVLILYKEFRKHLVEKDWKSASYTVMMLLQDTHLPTKFEIVLLIDNLAILKESTHYYRADQLIDLLEIFKQVEKERSSQDIITNYYESSQHKKAKPDIVMSIIRERLAYKAAYAPAAC